MRGWEDVETGASPLN